MALTAKQARRVLEIRADANALIQQLEDAASRELARVIALELETIERLVAEGVIQSADQALVALEVAVDAISARGADVMTALASDVLDVSLGATVESVAQFEVVSARALAVASQSTRAEFYDYLLRDGHANWYGRLSDEMRSSVQEAVLDITVRPVSGTEAAKRLAEASDISMARARRIVRTESTRADAAVSVSFAESAGMDEFVNVGVGDSRQSDICREASKQPAKTVPEWRASQGLPPRHPNCRCGLVPVPQPFEPSDKLLEEAGVID